MTNDILSTFSRRIYLRHWQLSDAEVLYKYASDPVVGERAGWPPHQSVEESREVIRAVFSGDTSWAIVDRVTDEPIGAVGYGDACNCELPARPGEQVIGYWVGRPWWNRGICSEALTIMMHYIRLHTGISSLISGYFVNNPASGRVMEKCGFVPTGEEVMDNGLYTVSPCPVRVMRCERLRPLTEVPAPLINYVETEILSRYDAFDAAHRRDHVSHVIRKSQVLSRQLGADEAMAYTIAAYHDTGLIEGRARHHEHSGRIVRDDRQLHRWFTDEEMRIMAEAVEDHRASGGHEPRSLYGRIVADADRQLEGATILRRTIQYGLANYPSLGEEEQYGRAMEHIRKKYGEGGYLKIWLPGTQSEEELNRIRQLLNDEVTMQSMFYKIYREEIRK